LASALVHSQDREVLKACRREGVVTHVQILRAADETRGSGGQSKTYGDEDLTDDETPEEKEERELQEELEKWKQKLDVRSGRKYWQHAETRERLWTEPEEMLRAKQREAAAARKAAEDEERAAAGPWLNEGILWDRRRALLELYIDEGEDGVDEEEYREMILAMDDDDVQAACEEEGLTL
jgi:hypothetical protein